MTKTFFWFVLVIVFANVMCQNSNSTEEIEVPKKKKGDGDGCGSHLTVEKGGFHLNITNLNVTNQECVWNIQGNTSYLVLFFKTLFLDEKDTINVYSVKTNKSLLKNPILANKGSVTIILDESDVTIRLKGSNINFIRNLVGLYTTDPNQALSIDPEITTLYSPIYYGNETDIKVMYSSLKIHGKDVISTFVFEEFNFTNSKIEFGHSTHDGEYKNEQVEIFPKGDETLTITLTLNSYQFPTKESYVLKRRTVNSECSGYYEINIHDPHTFLSPEQTPINGSDSFECHWLFYVNGGSLSVKFDDLHFESPLDIVAINDGGNEMSPMLQQVTSTNRNSTMDVPIRSSGSYLWIAFKPVDFSSKVKGTVSDHAGGGFYRRNGTIKAENPATDTIFMLEVDSGQIVYLSFSESILDKDAEINIYEGFDQPKKLTSLKSSNIWYPVMSQSTKMMVVATGFSKSKFTAEFKGISPGCHHMSTLSNENYILSKNCNTSCIWVIAPQNTPGSNLLLNLQYISLSEGDSIEILQLDAAKTLIGKVPDNATFVPQIVIPSNVGALVNITRKACLKQEKIVLVGHSSYLPGCGNLIAADASSKFSIMSPNYPDTYPVLANCKWNITTSKDNIMHLVFNSYKLAPNHCLKINNNTLSNSDSGLPEDLFLVGSSLLEFNAGNCGKSTVSNELESSKGFELNGTVADCGGVMDQKVGSGEFSVPPNKTFCIWKVSIPATDGTSGNVNIISFTVSKKDETGNYKLQIYDGSSVREPEVGNDTYINAWSRTNNLIFIYKRVDLAKPSTLLSVKYATVGCDSNNLCENKMCLHPDWRCNGINDCGDFTDEKNCASVPVPPETKIAGYTSLAFWLTITLMFTTGVILGIAGPICYQKYKNGQYRRFGDDFSVVH